MNIKMGYVFLFLIFISLAVYYPTNFAPYNSLDDELLVFQLLNQDHFSLVRHFRPSGTYDYYRPLLTLSFEIDKYVGGLQEPFMHLLNILLHVLNVILVLLLASHFSKFVDGNDKLLPFLSALLFAIHPLNTEAVNWIAGRTDLLAGTFVFFSFISILKAIETRQLLWGWAAAISFFSGALCKETTLFLLPGVLLLCFWRPPLSFGQWKGRWMIIGLFFIAIIVYFALRSGAYTTDRGVSSTAKLVRQVATANPLPSASIAQPQVLAVDVARVALKVSGFYAVKLFQPLPLNFAINRLSNFYVLPGIVLVVAFLFLVFRRKPIDFLFMLAMVVGASALLVAFTCLAWTPIGERYMYIPSGFFSVGIVFVVARWVKRLNQQKVAMTFVIMLFVTFAYATVDRNIIWQDNFTLFQDTVRKSPDFGPAKNELARALETRHCCVEATYIMGSATIPEGQAASLNKTALLVDEGRFHDAKRTLVKRLAAPGQHEVKILEMLIKVNSEIAQSTKDKRKQRTLYQENIRFLVRLESITHNPFHCYRLGRIYLILNNQHEAQRCFSEAAKRLPDDSLYKTPAAKLAKKLLQG